MCAHRRSSSSDAATKSFPYVAVRRDANQITYMLHGRMRRLSSAAPTMKNRAHTLTPYIHSNAKRNYRRARSHVFAWRRRSATRVCVCVCVAVWQVFAIFCISILRFLTTGGERVRMARALWWMRSRRKQTSAGVAQCMPLGSHGMLKWQHENSKTQSERVRVCECVLFGAKPDTLGLLGR